MNTLIRTALRVLAVMVVAVLGSATAGAAPTPPGTASGPACSWQFMTDSQVRNVAFPDVNATYWVMPYVLGPGDSLTLSGQYPRARYFSLNTYGTNLDTIDVLRDDQIRPDPGSSNPYVPNETSLPGRSWRATVVSGEADRSHNEISGLPAAGAQRIPSGFIIIRVYVPDDPSSPNGGVALPTVTMHLGGTTVPLNPCAQPSDSGSDSAPGAGILTRLFETAATDAFPPGTPEATFANPATTTGLFANGDNKYIAAGLTYRPGRVAVIRGKAPSFPDTRIGVPAGEPGKSLRYWSMCQNDRVSPYPVVACAADYQTSLDADGYYTYVIAPPSDLASLSDPTVTLIPWGDTGVPDKVLIMRHMLPSDAFYPYSVQASQASGGDPSATMGEYFPRATYCGVSELENQGWQRCYDYGK